MASLPIDPTFARQAPYTPKPNIRVVFLPGPAQTAMAGELAKLPAETLEATLEELEIAALARDVIALAKTRLSTAIYPAFLRWAEAAFYAHVADNVGGDEGQRRTAAAYEARDALSATPAVSPSDYTLKTHLVQITGKQEILTSLGDEGHFNWSGDNVGLIKKLDGLVVKAFEYSGNPSWLSAPICNAVCQGFREALAAQDAAPMPSNDGLPLRPLLIERNALVQRLREGEDLDEAAMNAACVELNRLDTIITSSPANTADDAVVKLLTLAQISAEGHEVDDGESLQAIIEARKHFGIGYVDADVAAGIAADARPHAAPVTDTHPNEFRNALDGSRLADQRLNSLPSDYEDTHPAEYEIEANLACTASNIADEAVPASWAEFLELLDHMSCKGQMFVTKENAARLRSHADRLLSVATNGDGAHLQSDKLLLDTFATMQREMQLWFDQGPGTQEEDVAADARASALEDVLFAQRANTIEGVIAQLRETFRHLDGNAWSDHATLDPDHPEFQRGVKNTDFFTRALWHSIEDLARIGGVNLTEVRA